MRLILYILLAKAVLYGLTLLWPESEPERTFGARPPAAVTA